jgi:hypothetical protein
MHRSDDISTVIARLRGYHATEAREQFTCMLVHWIEDPLRPKTARGHVRVSPVLLFLLLVLALTAGTFLVFSLVQR